MTKKGLPVVNEVYAQFVTAKTTSLKKTTVGLTPIRESDIQSKTMTDMAPKLNKKEDPKKWLSDKQAPWAKLANEKPKGETVQYDKLLGAWKEGRVR